jgi:3-oxoacyl-[acyl-carrier protein] reductase
MSRNCQYLEGMNNDKVAIFGATGGIGSELSRAMSDQSILALLGRDQEKLSNLADELGAHSEPIQDLSWGELDRALAAAESAMGGLTGVVSCLGSIILKPIHLTRENEWDATIEVNLKSSAAILASSIKRIKKTGGSNMSVVFISTVATGIGLPNHEAISAAKAGVEGLVKSAAATYARQGIRINAVAPGLTHTPMTDRICSNPEVRKNSEKMHPLGRIGEPGDIVRAITWLMSPEARWVTGQIIRVDGGLSTLQSSG